MTELIRYSKPKDEEQIKGLLYLCFGEMVIQAKAYEGIATGRYLCYIVDGKIVAITGFCHDDEFHGIQITWTCTHPDYRHRGYMQELFKRLLATTDEDVYCSCWYIGAQPANLHHLMDAFGFTICINSYAKRDINHYCPFPVNCPYRTEYCKCGNHLYVRKHR